MDDIHRILDTLYSNSQKDVLATIIQVEGSAYRKSGASMLFREDETQVGLLSAGCLEEDLAVRVKEVAEIGASCMVTFDLRDDDDLSWGQGAGCNGVIYVLLEPINACFHNHLRTLKCHLDNGESVIVVKKLTEELAVSDYIFIVDNQHVFGEWRGEIPDQVWDLVNEAARPTLKSGVTYIPELSISVYVHCFQPKPRLIVFGAGADAQPLVKFAVQVGFSVIVADWRPALCNNVKFPDADELIIGFPKDAVNKLTLQKQDFVIILTHQFQRDKELLELLSKQELRYVGVLGSHARTQRLFDNKEIPANIYTPVGLPIGANGPEEIAISILAELISIQRKRDSRIEHLHGAKGVEIQK